uniref:Putative secreted protein n=1 Tax=Anopheles triannulatus TaxID=58253 RepID=A0A2M4B6Q7_9DIPT
MAVTMLAACALLPPMLPATAEPVMFFSLLHCTRVRAFVLKIDSSLSAGMVVSQTTRFPRPLIQLMAAGFLSEQKLPLSEIITISGNTA